MHAHLAVLAQASESSGGASPFFGYLLLGGLIWVLYHVFKPRGWTVTSSSRHEVRPH